MAQSQASGKDKCPHLACLPTIPPLSPLTWADGSIWDMYLVISNSMGFLSDVFMYLKST